MSDMKQNKLFPNKFKGHSVPEFSVKKESVFKPHYRFYMWHPCYPYWSRSCYYGNSPEEAWESLEEWGGEPCYAILLVEERVGDYSIDYKIIDKKDPENLSGWEPEFVKKCLKGL